MFENYSREKFENVEKKKEKILETMGGPEDLTSVLKILECYLTDRKVDKLLGKSQTEAKELNEEYERLMQKIVDDIAVLRTFEREKLGMSEKENKEPEEQ